MQYWLVIDGIPLSRVLARTTASMSGRAGMKTHVTARPTIFFSGCRTTQPSSYWLYGVPRPPPPPAPPRPLPVGAPGEADAQLMVISSWESPRALAMMLSGTLG